MNDGVLEEQQPLKRIAMRVAYLDLRIAYRAVRNAWHYHAHFGITRNFHIGIAFQRAALV